MISHNVIGILNNTVFLLCLGFLYDVLVFKEDGEKGFKSQIVSGFLLGTIGVVVMLTPWEFSSGVIFDTRSVLLCIVGTFFGTIPLLITILITGLYRLYAGGPGVWMGVSVILTSGLIGWVWRHQRKANFDNVSWLHLYFLGLVVHAVMLLGTVLLPKNIVMEVLSKITLPVMAIYPIVTMLLGLLMLNKHKNKLMRLDLFKRERQYKAILETAMDGFLSIDHKGHILEVNKAYCLMSGYQSKELLQMNISNVEAVDSETVFFKHIQKISECGHERFESQHRRKDGTVFDVEVTAQHNRYDIGLFICFFKDITQVKISENKLKESNERFQLLFEYAPDALFIEDREDNILDANQAACTMMGYSKEELLQMSVADLQAPEVRGVKGYIVNRELARDGIFETLNIHKTGTIIPVEIHNHELNIHGEDVVLSIVRDLSDRKKIEDRIKSSERRHRSILKTAMDGFVMVDLLGNISQVNDAYCLMIGYSKEEILCLNISDLVADESPSEIRQRLTALKERGYERFESKHRKKDGKMIDVEVSAMYRKEDPEPIFVCFVRDITDKKKQEKELFLHSLVLDQIRDHVTVTNLDGVITYVNKATERTLGIKKDEIVGRKTDIYGEDSEYGASQKEIIEKTLAEGAWRGEVVNFDADGQKMVMHCRTSAVKNHRGEIVALSGVASDITKFKRWQGEQERLQAQLKNAMEIAQMGPWEYDVQRDTFIFNDQFYRIFDTSVDKEGGYEMSSEAYAQRFVHPEDRGLVEKEIRRAMATKDADYTSELEHRMLYADGQVGYLVVRYFIVKDADGNTVKTYGVNQDITERRQTEKSLQQAQKMESIGTLAGGIAHDFNNILFPIIGLTDLLLEDLPEDSFEWENVKEIHKAGLRGAELVKQILSFSRQHDHEFSPVCLQFVIKEVLKLTRASIPMEIDIKQMLDTECGLILADATQIHQIGMNLLTNAYHSLEGVESGKICVDVKEVVLDDQELCETSLPSGKYAMLSVEDNGVGIPKERLNDIFAPYFTTKPKGKGTGLGLSVVYGIVQEHSGQIRVQSQVGRGTVFKIYFPLMASEKVSEDESLEFPTEGGTERILVVDDENAIAELEKQLLERLGYNVSIQTKSPDALEAFKANPEAYDLIITDMSMPKMTGRQLAKELLAIKPCLPVIICTGFSEGLNQDIISEIGIKGLLMKPIVKMDLAKAVRQALDAARQID